MLFAKRKAGSPPEVATAPAGERIGVRQAADLKLFRNEWKYYLSLWDAQALKARLDGVIPHDEHAHDGGYMIRSLYFDDYWNSAYNDKLDGVQNRVKWRIRIYDCSDAVIKLERKVKCGSYIHKDSARLTRQEFEWIMDGSYGFLLTNPQPLCQEFYVACVAQLFRPKVLVDYEREPYVYDPGTVRITFDMNLRAAPATRDIFNPDLPTYNVVPYGETIMEVKFTEFLPQMIKELVPAGVHDFSAISKYVLCYEKVAAHTDLLNLMTKSEKPW